MSNGATFVYDGNGNMTRRVELVGSQRVTYTQGWDVENRLIAITNTLGQVTTYSYNASGQRVKRVDAGGTLVTLGAHFEQLRVGTAVTNTSYYYFGDQRVAMRQTNAGTGVSTVYWLHGDHLGSASLATTNNGTIVPNSVTRYKPFGEIRYPSSGSSSLPTDRTFTGQRSEKASFAGSLMDYGARLYSPLLGRFISADSIVPQLGDPQSLNRYAYARNSPLTRIDPSGHDDCAAGDTACWVNQWEWQNRWYEAHGHFWDGTGWNISGSPHFADIEILKQTLAEVGILQPNLGLLGFGEELGGNWEQHRAVQWAYFLYLLQHYGLRANMEVRFVNDTRADLLLLSRYSDKVWIWEIKPDNAYWRTEGPIQLAGYIQLIGGTPGFELPPLSIPLGDLIINSIVVF